MNVDDAEILDDHTCQLETVGKFNRGDTERLLSPACNLGGNFELGWQNAWQRDAGGLYLSSSQLQGKTVFRKLSPDGAGLGMLVGIERQIDGLEEDDPDAGRQRSWNYSAKLLTSFSFRDDSMRLHTNLGLNHASEDHRTRLSWGLGNELRLSGRVSFISEVFGQAWDTPSYQAGFRTTLVPDRVELDLTYGNTFGKTFSNAFATDTPGRYVALSMRFIAPQLLE